MQAHKKTAVYIYTSPLKGQYRSRRCKSSLEYNFDSGSFTNRSKLRALGIKIHSSTSATCVRDTDWCSQRRKKALPPSLKKKKNIFEKFKASATTVTIIAVCYSATRTYNGRLYIYRYIPRRCTQCLSAVLCGLSLSLSPANAARTYNFGNWRESDVCPHRVHRSCTTAASSFMYIYIYIYNETRSVCSRSHCGSGLLARVRVLAVK